MSENVLMFLNMDSLPTAEIEPAVQAGARMVKRLIKLQDILVMYIATRVKQSILRNIWMRRN